MEELVQGPTATRSSSSQSKFAKGLRGSLRSLTWKSSSNTTDSRTHRGFRSRILSQNSEVSNISKDWFEDFHLITREEIGLPPLPQSAPSSLTIFEDCTAVEAHTTTEHTLGKTFDPTYPTTSSSLPPLLIPDSQAFDNRISNYTESPTPTEFAQITSSFPLPPSHIPTLSSITPVNPCE